jgi:RNA polymerase sigma-70 factor (ECF subfamily)
LHSIEEKLLLKKVKQRDRKAAEKLIDAHYLLVYKFNFRFCRHKQLAQDLTQETFIRVWQAIDNYNGNSRFSTWLYRISYNLYLDQKKRRTISTSVFEKMDEKSYHIESPLEIKNQFQYILNRMNYLPEQLQHILILHYQQDLSFKEIAQILDIPKGTVKSRISNALKQLREIMEEKYVNKGTIGDNI